MTDQPPIAPPLPFTMKANIKEYRKRLGLIRIGLAVALSLIILVRFGVQSWLLFLVSVSVLIFIILFILAKRSLTATADSIEYKNAFGKTKSLRYDEVSSTKVFLAYIEAGFGFAPRLIIGSTQGRPFFNATTLYWRAEDIDALQAILKSKNVTVEVYTENAVSQTIAKQFPTYITPFEKHPFMFGFGFAFILAIVIVAGVFVFR